MTRLQRLYGDHGQSPWLDNLTRPYLQNGTLTRLIDDGIRGVTSNPTIFAIRLRAREGRVLASTPGQAATSRPGSAEHSR